MSTDTGTSLRISRIVNADREAVFRAWTEPEQIKRWSCPEGMNVADSQVDLTVGGRYRLRMESANGKAHTAVGVYREIESPSRLVYTWDWEEESIGETLVTVEFNDLGESTEVVLVHELFPSAEAKVGHEEGWTSCFNQLEKVFG
jgi:uncharacterized protein YndB with AHSA1/START domain